MGYCTIFGYGGHDTEKPLDYSRSFPKAKVGLSTFMQYYYMGSRSFCYWYTEGPSAIAWRGFCISVYLPRGRTVPYLLCPCQVAH